MGDEWRVADYFVVAGLPTNAEPLDFADARSSHSMDPITDITVIFPSLGERCPEGFTVLEQTPHGGIADLNHGSIHSPEVFICYRRGRDKPPLVDIGVLYENKERVLEDSKIVLYTPYKREANVNNSSTARIFLTYRRAPDDMAANELVVTDICVINETKYEKPPHAFCMIKKSLNKGVFGHAIYLCYKKSVQRVNLVTYKPTLLSRYPAVDHLDCPLPAAVPMFCMPMGVSLEVWPVKASQPAVVFSTFVLTVADAAEKMYGAAVTFYERYSVDQLPADQKTALIKSLTVIGGLKSKSEVNLESDAQTINANKCICILSHWPFFDCFEGFLRFIYNMSREGPISTPVERYISHLLEDVPFPSPQRPRILIQLSVAEKLILSQPAGVSLPKSGAGFLELLETLCVEDVLLVLLLVLMEHKILVHSLRPNVLTAVVEAISQIVFPFKWPCPYIPLCPLELAEVLHAPVPFLIGVDSRIFDTGFFEEPPSDVTYIDLDTSFITISGEKGQLSHKILPKRAARTLKATLEFLSEKNHVLKYSRPSLERDATDEMLDFQAKEKEQKLQLEVQEAFLRFMASILRGYRNYLKPIAGPPTDRATDSKSLFDFQGFLKSRDKSSQRFYERMTATQMFNRFIEVRSFVCEEEVALAFFDYCIDRVEGGDGNFKLLEFEEAHSERTVFIPPPDPTGLPDDKFYSYDYFVLDPTLFKMVDPKNRLQVAPCSVAPGSPMARRTKHEVKSAQKVAKNCYDRKGHHWACFLLTTCYSIWFIHLPSYVTVDADKACVCLKTAYDLLDKLHKLKLQLTDEVCYRVMMQLCGVYGQPSLAVKLMMQMKNRGIQPNALTYGYYNRAVLEAKWPQDFNPRARTLWNRLRNVTMAVSYFRQQGTDREGVGGSRDKLPIAASRSSLASLDEDKSKSPQFAQFEKHCTRIGTIVKTSKPSFLRDNNFQSTFESSAGLLITGDKRHASALELRCHGLRRNSCTEFSTLSGQSSVRATETRLRRGSLSPITSGPQPKDAVMSFANDASILEKYLRSRKLSAETARSTPKKSSSNTRESSESLDQTDTEFSKFRRRGERMSSVMMSHLSNLWRGSEDSVSSELSGQEETPVKRKPNGKPPWSSSEVLLTDERRVRSDYHSEQRAASESLEDSRKHGTRSDRACSEDVWSASGVSSVTDVSNVEGKNNEEDADQSLNDSERSRSESSERVPAGMISPVRTPVTENDPLGALHNDPDDNDLTITNREDANNLLNKKRLYEMTSTPQKNITSESKKRTWIDGQNGIDFLFSNFSDCDKKEANKKSMQRSSTLPGAVSEASPVVSSPSLGLNLSLSSFKMPFGRMSPCRLSIKKAELKICKTLENAISGSKKSNEILQVSISTVKSAANIIGKKWEEVMSANSTPVKSLHQSQEFNADEIEGIDRNTSLDFEGWSNLKVFGDISRKSSTVLMSQEPVSDEKVRDKLYGGNKPVRRSLALSLLMTTCCRCKDCSVLLHDEEIIAGWSPEDSNLNTKCHFCGKMTLPFLTVTIQDYRAREKTSTSGSDLSLKKAPSIAEIFRPGYATDEPFILEPISVPYLNPLVLRKELENILQHKGDPSLTEPSFVDQHPIIYWNLVWWFERIMVPSHLPSLILSSCILNKQQTVHSSWEGEKDPDSVAVVCLWDNPRLHEEVGQPLYMLWQQKERHSSLVSALITDRNAVSRRDIAKIIAHLKMDNLREPMLQLIKERRKHAKIGFMQGHSLYRNILFLALVEFGRNLLDLETFEREYNIEYQKLLEEGCLLQKCDKPPVSASYRNYFQPLMLLQELT